MTVSIERPTTVRGPAAWQVGLAGTAMIAATFGFARYSYGLYAPALRAEFDLSVGLVGLIGSATYVGYLLSLLVVGVFSQRLGPRPLVVIGGLSAAVGMLAVGLATGPWLLVAGLVLAGTSPGWAWAPYSDAVDRLVEPGKRQRVMGLIPSGTAFGVVLAGPAALFLYGPVWRVAWLVFAVITFAVTVYNALILPGTRRRETPDVETQARVGPSWFLRPGVTRHYLTAFSYGLIGAIYWTFAVEAIAADSTRSTAPLFWTLMGAVGMLGALAGVAIGRYGLRVVHIGLFASMAAAILLLGLAPGSLAAVIASAVLYGPAFMAGSSLLQVWSYELFPDRPTTGFSATVFFIGIGTILGPTLAGQIASGWGLGITFVATATVAAATLAIAPRRQAAIRTPRR
ncbi:MFS transporter [Stackebrandtia nassauensis]|uniref:Major facilitator superfamily MFS_1 n=1 Tax=Stackebrandtia nassauensis (strain DSM 44728 / CIP 108903 / NRRL B-16338 / NBRC 102104 / LLR-40K-21) TaxID=446470 RepID=D3Q5T1_STANL|nr:MFS transporter [Stackebrandtia nassauensis]ADD40230.1 major facilitator superfamily MFS_1 [Stackebrandtia nassauensis DSM 44728]